MARGSRGGPARQGSDSHDRSRRSDAAQHDPDSRRRLLALSRSPYYDSAGGKAPGGYRTPDWWHVHAGSDQRLASGRKIVRRPGSARGFISRLQATLCVVLRAGFGILGNSLVIAGGWSGSQAQEERGSRIEDRGSRTNG